jgi:hypothetical protein
MKDIPARQAGILLLVVFIVVVPLLNFIESI